MLVDVTLICNITECLSAFYIILTNTCNIGCAIVCASHVIFWILLCNIDDSAMCIYFYIKLHLVNLRLILGSRVSIGYKAYTDELAQVRNLLFKR